MLLLSHLPQILEVAEFFKYFDDIADRICCFSRSKWYVGEKGTKHDSKTLNA
jgi:hypothetical protein